MKTFIKKQKRNDIILHEMLDVFKEAFFNLKGIFMSHHLFAVFPPNVRIPYAFVTLELKKKKF